MLTKNSVIFSVFQNIIEDEENHKQVIKLLQEKGIDFDEVLRKEYDISRLAFVIPVNKLTTAIDIAYQYNQDKILLIGDDSNTYYIFCIPQATFKIGKMAEFTNLPEKARIYIFDPSNKKYYIVI